MKITVLDFSNNSVDIVSTTQEFIDAFALSYYESEETEREDFDLTDDFKIELFLSDHCQYCLDNCQWMVDSEGIVKYNFDLTEQSFGSNPNNETTNTTRYRLPIHWVNPLINGDFTGCNDEEEGEIKSFLEGVDGDPVDVDWDTEGFYSTNDANRIGGTCVDIIFRTDQ